MADDHEKPFRRGEDKLRELHDRLETGGEELPPLTYETLRREAEKHIESDAFGFVTTGAGTGTTKEANCAAFENWRIVPRVLRGISDRDMSVRLFDEEIPAPILFAPIGGQALVHDDGERALAKAAASLGLPLVLSSGSSYSMEEVADEMDGSSRWFQLYVSPDRDLVTSFIERAESAGYGAIVVTVDNPVRGWRPVELEEGFNPRGAARKGNYFTDPVFGSRIDGSPEEDFSRAMKEYRDVSVDASISWDDVGWIREQTSLPVVLKGILHPDDAELAVDAGVDGIVVSTHGGNHIDGAVGSLEVLPDVVDRVDDRIPVLFDSGIRSGTDVFKALALGADAVLVGRPYLFGLGIAGADGVRAVVENMLAELDVTMANCGCATVDAIDSSLLRRQDRCA